MKAILKKITSTHDKLRTNEVKGDLLYLPEVGTSVIMFSEPLDATVGSTRMVKTSNIKELTLLSPDVYSITTLNSVYELEILRNPVSE